MKYNIIYLILMSLFFNSCSEYFIEQKHGVEIDGIALNYFDLKVGFLSLLSGLLLMMLYLYIEKKHEDSISKILKTLKDFLMFVGVLLIIIGVYFLLQLIALIEYFAWYLFFAVIVCGGIIVFVKDRMK